MLPPMPTAVVQGAPSQQDAPGPMAVVLAGCRHDDPWPPTIRNALTEFFIVTFPLRGLHVCRFLCKRVPELMPAVAIDSTQERSGCHQPETPSTNGTASS